MKNLFFAIILTFLFLPLYGQGSDALDIHFNFQGAFRGEPAEDGLQGRFLAKDLRLEFRGNISDNLWYRYRQKLYKPADTGTLDHFGKNVDFMMVGWRFAPKWKLEAGKLCQHWGGFEYDEVPMYIYRYSDFLDNMEIFFAGAALTYELTPGHDFIFEISNNRNDLLSNAYGARFPLSYILNWNGSFLGGKVQTRWAAGFMHQTADANARLVTLGQKYNSDRFQIYLDYMLECDGIDRLGIASRDLPGVGFRDVSYSSWILKANWQFTPGWNLLLSANTTGVNVPDLAVSSYRRHFGGHAALEYFPVNGQDLRFFLCWIGDRYNFRDNPLALQSYGTHCVELGIMYNLKCF